MKKVLIFVTLLSLYSCATKKSKELYPSETFIKFTNSFFYYKLPIKIDSIGNFNIWKLESKDSVVKFLYDYKNFGTDGVPSEYYNIDPWFQIPCKNKNYISVAYIVNYRNGNRQVVLANFSIKTEQRISQLVLYGDDLRTYQLTSDIDTNLIITNHVIESTRFEWIPTFKNHPEYFYIFKYDRKYKIIENGEFILIDPLVKKQKFLAIKDGIKYIYPVMQPEKLLDTIHSLRIDAINPLLDTLLCPKPPKDYKLINENVY